VDKCDQANKWANDQASKWVNNQLVKWINNQASQVDQRSG